MVLDAQFCRLHSGGLKVLALHLQVAHSANCTKCRFDVSPSYNLKLGLTASLVVRLIGLLLVFASQILMLSCQITVID